MQREIFQPNRLLTERGELRERGYARKLILDYKRADIKARSYRIKEWDYYLVTNNEIGVALTIADNSYMGLISVSFLDFTAPGFKTTSIIKPLTFGRLKLPETSKAGDVSYMDSKVNIEFLNDGAVRHLNCRMNMFDKKKFFACELELFDEPQESMVVATPFAEDSKAFYYNQKINCMKARGTVWYGDKEFHFTEDTATGTLDWGRGVWTYNNTWYWGSASGYLEGKSFGFNIGYGFGDTSAASENMLFYEGKAHKLQDVNFNIPMRDGHYDYMSPWTFTSGDRRFEMDFVPILDRKDYTSLGIISSEQHQVFGRFSGRAVLDDGRVLQIRDFLGFAERVANKW